MMFLPISQNDTHQLILHKVRATEAADDVHGRMRGEVARYSQSVAVSRFCYLSAIVGGLVRQGQPREG